MVQKLKSINLIIFYVLADFNFTVQPKIYKNENLCNERCSATVVLQIKNDWVTQYSE